jgi:hypothetical protein
MRGRFGLMGTSIAAALAAVAESQARRVFGFDNIRRYLQQQKSDHSRGAHNSIAKLNRHTGRPHEHKREIARRTRQAAARVAA